MSIKSYIGEVSKKYAAGISTEHTYRGYLQVLIESLVSQISVTNEPQRIKCGSPDYIITRKDIPVGYIEAKDVGADLDSKNYQEQFERYRNSLSNLIITDYLEFRFYRDGEFTKAIRIAEISGKKVVPAEEKFDEFEALIKDFCTSVGQTIKSSSKLSKIMASKARLLANVIENALEDNETTTENNTLKDQLAAFQQILIHDLKIKEFSDIYAQTITYGMFAARLHDTTLDTFTRQEAAELIPKTNPFLRKLFQYIAGYDLDDRIKWIVDDLADIFRATNVADLLKDFGKATKQSDPIIHFYETFLSEYDPALRKSRGVWYTPEPVVNFIVRAVDDILKQDFGLKDGLADTSKTKIKVDIQGKKIEQEVHKVQILDPAAGTGTFLAEIIKQVYKKFEGQQGIWNKYVDNHLIPRLHGFEILMASYAMAHLKLDLLLGETGYRSQKDQRFRVYLTNSLEEHHPDTGTLFASWLSEEANEANHVKRDTPVMVVLGNPPYSGESANKGDWIMNLMEDYKKEPGGKEKLKERNPKWINDDYVKFIRYGQYFIEKNGEGVLAFINPHGFLDNPTFRGMRWNLLKTFDKMYSLDLHGNSKKKEVAPDGGIDQNVFDIQQGVSINIFVKTGRKKTNELGKSFTYDLYGKRESKYAFLNEKSLNTITYKEILNKAPMYYMVQKDSTSEKKYNAGISITELFCVNNMGITSGNDDLFIAYSEKEIKLNEKINCIRKICYRPFDTRFIYYNPEKLARARIDFMRHLSKSNLALSLIRRSRKNDFSGCVIINDIADKCISSTLDNANIFPIYLYPGEEEQQNLLNEQVRTSNMDIELIKAIEIKVGLIFKHEKISSNKEFSPIDLLDYIYAVLYSPSYREKYKEFLKIDFPRVPYPKDKETFWNLVKLGGELRKIHLLENPVVEKFITKYPAEGNNEVGKIEYKDVRVWINDKQFFDKVPQIAWDFFIGGYQPAQKWLKDRKGRELSFEDIIHYQKIIVALVKTDEIMKEIDKIEIE